MTRVLIVGATGLLGHKVWQVLGRHCEVYGTVRRFDNRLRATGIFDEERMIKDVDAWNMDSVQRALKQVKPNWVISCVGLVKQKEIAHDPTQAIYINALFPHLLAEACCTDGIRVIQISTDCVFSGKRGKYTEADASDAEDLYGRTKFLGELTRSGCLTLRTSIVGRDLFSDYSLIDWFLSQAGGEVRGYDRAIYSGLTTAALSREVWKIISQYPDLEGLYHVSSPAVTKFALLQMVNTAFNTGINIIQDQQFNLDRSLVSDRYWSETRSSPPQWREMVDEMAGDPTNYREFHSRRFASQAGG